MRRQTDSRGITCCDLHTITRITVLGKKKKTTREMDVHQVETAADQNSYPHDGQGKQFESSDCQTDPRPRQWRANNLSDLPVSSPEAF